MKKKFFTLILISTVTLSFFSCKKDKDHANEINDSQGLNVKLNWSITDGSDAIANADLDYYVYKGVGASKETTELVSGNNSGAFEDADFLDTLADGDYTVEVDYYSIGKSGKFNLVFKAKGSDKTYSFNDNSFTTANDGQNIDFVKITKSGTKYTVTKL